MLKIKEFEDYLISNNGKVFSIRKNKFLKQVINKYGYCKVTLQKDNFRKIFSIHRLVAIAYILNTDNKPEVNHINGIKTDNRVENLEWVTAKENTNKALEIGLFNNMKVLNSQRAKQNNLSRFYTLANKITKKKISQFDKENNFINEFESISQASKTTGIKIASISYVANNKRKTAGGFIWHFA